MNGKAVEGDGTGHNSGKTQVVEATRVPQAVCLVESNQQYL